MLQLQYFNTKLKNKQINDILGNYKLKYSHIKNNIETKLNELIKLFLNDISTFLEKTEEIATGKKKLNNYEKMKNELESIRNQLKAKIYNEHKIKNELEILNQENAILKLKLKSLNEKIKNLNDNNTNNTNTINNNKKRPLSNLTSKSSRDINLTKSKINLRNSFDGHNKSLISDFKKSYINSVERLEKKANMENSFNKLDLSLTSKFDYSSRVLENLEKSYSNILQKERKKNFNSILQKSSNPILNTIINTKNKNNITLKKKKNISKFLMSKERINQMVNSNNKLNNTKNNNINAFALSTPYPQNIKENENNIKDFKELDDLIQDNSADIAQGINIEYEDFGKKINAVIDDELKNLELDEEKIKKLLEKINNGNNIEIDFNNINDNIKTND